VNARKALRSAAAFGGSGVLAAIVYRRLTGTTVTAHGYRRTTGWRIYDAVCALADRTAGWDRLPTPLGLATLIGLRNTLRQDNLYDTSGEPAVDEPALPPMEPRFFVSRASQGVYNDLAGPRMGMAGSRFGRNVPLEATQREPEPDLLTPNPRVVSREFMTRTEFKPATGLNLFVATWIQFMIRDWFSHGRGDPAHSWQLPLEPGDPWPSPPLTVLKTLPDTTRPAGSTAPLTYLNTASHWWDGSQLYGVDPQTEKMVRAGEGGKLHVGPGGIVPLPEDPKLDPRLAPGWWLGLQVMLNLFALEHNAVCDRLAAEYPEWSDDRLFEHARLIVSALLAKIHTVEWTPAVISHPTTEIAMRANWFGIAGERVKRSLGRISPSEVISGIPGSKHDHFGVPYSLTEEFAIVYRMHPLIADDYTFRSAADDTAIEQRTLPELAGPNSQGVLERIGMRDLLYSFGTAPPGLIELNNFPRFLQQFERPDGKLMDIAATDILRTRELGVPRYNEFRRLLHLAPARDFSELTNDPALVDRLRAVYGDIERLDLIVGMFAEKRPKGFAFSDTAFRIFILMASRRINSDRFLTDDYNASVYTQAGIDWVEGTSFGDVLRRHYPELAPALRGATNAFRGWTRIAPQATRPGAG
jgi:Animal haem peroxidase